MISGDATGVGGDAASTEWVSSKQGRARTSAWGEVAVPSSMIFVGLVVMWLLILVPAVARRRQEVARPSVTALSGRVLERSPRRDPVPDRAAAGRDLEVDVRHELEPEHAVATRSAPEGRSRLPQPRGGSRGQGLDRDELDHSTGRALDGDPDLLPDRRREPERAPGAPPRYRPGRGGYDPQAAAMAARARYAFRQRVVLFLLILAVGSAVAAYFTVPQLWWAHGAVDVVLVGYLTYLRRQVRVEEAIRRRRSARVGAPRRAPYVETDDADGEPAPQRSRSDSPSTRPPAPEAAEDDDRAATEDDSESDPGTPVTSSPTIPKPADPVESLPALPRIKPNPTPPVPIGTTLVEGEEDDPALHELESITRPDYRRASGQ